MFIRLASLTLLAGAASACTTDLDCSLNGACAASACVCDAGWVSGAKHACERLDLLPADLSHGYNHLRGHDTDNGSTSSWGATQLKGDDGLYHTFVGEMARNCGINGYENNEAIIHTTSKSALGPFVRHGTLTPFASSSICPHAQRDPKNGDWLIFHTGCGNHSDPNSEGYGTNHSAEITNCVNGSTPLHKTYGPSPGAGGRQLRERAAKRTCGVASDITSVFRSKSPYGPWTQHLLRTKPKAAKMINGVAWPGCNSNIDPQLCSVPDNLGGNPTALILPNGTTIVLFRTFHNNITACELLGAVIRDKGCVGKPGCPNGYPGCTLIGLAVADSWDGLYDVVGGPMVNFQQEDPFIYKTKRGFHAVYHGMDPWPDAGHSGRHAYSVNGLDWHGGDEDAFTSNLTLVGGSKIRLARRERPELVHDEQERPLHLLSGAQFGPDVGNPGDQTFTLCQGVRQASASPPPPPPSGKLASCCARNETAPGCHGNPEGCYLDPKGKIPFGYCSVFC